MTVLKFDIEIINFGNTQEDKNGTYIVIDCIYNNVDSVFYIPTDIDPEEIDLFIEYLSELSSIVKYRHNQKSISVGWLKFNKLFVIQNERKILQDILNLLRYVNDIYVKTKDNLDQLGVDLII